MESARDASAARSPPTGQRLPGRPPAPWSGRLPLGRLLGGHPVRTARQLRAKLLRLTYTEMKMCKRIDTHQKKKTIHLICLRLPPSRLCQTFFRAVACQVRSHCDLCLAESFILPRAYSLITSLGTREYKKTLRSMITDRIVSS